MPKRNVMVPRLHGRNKMNPCYSTEDIGRIIAGIKADEELKELA